MNIDKLKHQHQDIIGAISALRTLAQAGVAQNAADIARLVVSMSSTIKLHLAVEDQALYPALRRGGNPELARMGAQIELLDERTARITGPRQLHGAEVVITDLRAGATLILAALAADGTSVIDGIEHVDRGYEQIEAKLIAIGARINRIEA